MWPLSSHQKTVSARATAIDFQCHMRLNGNYTKRQNGFIAQQQAAMN